jgi:hypothetical protein
LNDGEVVGCRKICGRSDGIDDSSFVGLKDGSPDGRSLSRLVGRDVGLADSDKEGDCESVDVFGRVEGGSVGSRDGAVLGS